MITLQIIIVCMGIISISATTHSEPNNRQHDSPTSDLLAKFHQHDYKLEFERVELVSCNKEHFKKFDIVTYKYNRTTPVVNATWLLRNDFHGHDVRSLFFLS
ncbi:hypothetical protein ILUMI_10612 [Ignelater luminosus]|uniref:Uncharacterized protein n=1 Tax=Ignelater luminosus TaxID=2038154 RepID=A0A8K0D034_IGNLU|nr:hypothetical protein ILUMI_10612 [Ignelater luminosus]